MFNRKVKQIFITLVLKYLTVRCNRSLEIHNIGDCFDVIGNKCPIHIANDVQLITEEASNILLSCIKEAALCKMLPKGIYCTPNNTCKWLYMHHYSPHIISMNLNCNENERVSVFGGQCFVDLGIEINIRHKGMYAKCEHKSCNYSFCCMNNHPEQTQKHVQKLSSDDFLLLKWNQDCEHKQKCTIQVPRWDMTSAKNNVKLDYKNDCKSSYPYHAQNKCISYRMNVQYHCLPVDYTELDSVTENKAKILCIIFGFVTFALLAIVVIYKVYRRKQSNPSLQNTGTPNLINEIPADLERVQSKNIFNIRDYDIIEELDMKINNGIPQCYSDSGNNIVNYDNNIKNITQHQHNSEYDDKYQNIYI